MTTMWTVSTDECEHGWECECMACLDSERYDDHTCMDLEEVTVCRHELDTGTCALCDPVPGWMVKDCDEVSGRRKRERAEFVDWLEWGEGNDKVVYRQSFGYVARALSDEEWVTDEPETRRLVGRYRRMVDRAERPDWLRVAFNGDYFLGFYHDYEDAASKFPVVEGPDDLEPATVLAVPVVVPAERSRRVSRWFGQTLFTDETRAHTAELRAANDRLSKRIAAIGS